VQITSGIIITKALCPTIMHCCCTPIGLLTVSGIHKRSINKLVTRGKPELDIFQNKNAKWWLAGRHRQLAAELRFSEPESTVPAVCANSLPLTTPELSLATVDKVFQVRRVVCRYHLRPVWLTHITTKERWAISLEALLCLLHLPSSPAMPIDFDQPRTDATSIIILDSPAQQRPERWPMIPHHGFRYTSA
jgi:hypothetical protein